MGRIPDVCILSESFHPVVGGLETQVRALAAGLVARGSTVTVLTRRSEPGTERFERIDGARVHRLPPVGPGRLRKWGMLASCVPALVRLRERYDLVLVTGFRILGMAAVPVARALGKPCVLRAESLGEMSGEYFAAGLESVRMTTRSRPFRWFLSARNALLRRADAFVAISTEVASELVACGVERSSVSLIPHGVETGRFRPARQGERMELRRRLGLPHHGALVIYTGRLVAYKGLPSLVRAWRRVAGEFEDAVLVLVGAGGVDIHDCEAELREFVAEHGLADSVVFTGSVDNVDEYLRASDIFCFPTEDEAFGLSLIEAMACGLAVVTTPVGGVTDIVDPERDSLVVPPRDPGALGEALGSLLSDPRRARSLGEAARRKAVERFSTESVNARYAELLAELVDPP